MNPKELGFLGDIARALHEARMVILDNLQDVDPEARNRPLQDYVHDALLKLNRLDRLNAELMFGPLDDDNDEEESFEWDEQTECTIETIDAGNVYIKYKNGGGRSGRYRFLTGELKIRSMPGKIRRRDGTTYEGWFFEFSLGKDEMGRNVLQTVSEGTKGWICRHTPSGVKRFVPRPVEQQ